MVVKAHFSAPPDAYASWPSTWPCIMQMRSCRSNRSKISSLDAASHPSPLSSLAPAPPSFFVFFFVFFFEDLASELARMPSSTLQIVPR